MLLVIEEQNELIVDKTNDEGAYMLTVTSTNDEH
jgi:hypothetical protein